VTDEVSSFTKFCEYILARLYEFDQVNGAEYADLNEFAGELAEPPPTAWPYQAMEELKRQGLADGFATLGNPPNVEAMITGAGRLEVEERERDRSSVTHAYRENPSIFVSVAGSGNQVTVGNQGDTRHEAGARRADRLTRFSTWIGIVAGFCVIGGAAYGIVRWAESGNHSNRTDAVTPSCDSVHAPFANPQRTFVEIVWPHSHANAFRDCDGPTGPGQIIEPNQVVRVFCRVHDVSIPSVKPGGYWYRIASSPWNGNYWSPANTFLNGDPKFGPYHHPTDLKVPTC
jgi:hypothetical protein